MSALANTNDSNTNNCQEFLQENRFVKVRFADIVRGYQKGDETTHRVRIQPQQDIPLFFATQEMADRYVAITREAKGDIAKYEFAGQLKMVQNFFYLEVFRIYQPDQNSYFNHSDEDEGKKVISLKTVREERDRRRARVLKLMQEQKKDSD